MDFIFENIRFYSKYLALGVAIIGTINYVSIRNTKARYFLFSVWYIVFTEFIGENFYKWFSISNDVVYNIYTVLQFLFYLWWFKSLLKLKKRKAIISVFMVLFLIFALYNSIFIQDFINESSSYTYALGVIFLVTSICYYFIEAFNSEKVLRIRQSSYFWFSIGLLLFNATFMPFYFAYDYLVLGNSKLLSTVNFFLCAIMYICFAIGFFKVKQSANEHPLS